MFRFSRAHVLPGPGPKTPVKEVDCACCLEKHSDGSHHYHVALKLSDPKKWLEAKRALEAQHGINVNISDHYGYYTAFQYINKCDDMVYRNTATQI